MQNKILLLSLAFLLTVLEGFSQFSPLFLTPSVNLDLPMFNPAFSGDVDHNRYYMMASSYRPRGRGLAGSNSLLAGYDNKLGTQNSTVQLTYGMFILRNEIDLSLKDVDSQNILGDINSFKYRYGTFEFNLGGRLPLRYRNENRTKKKLKEGFFDDEKVNPEKKEFLAPLTQSQLCSFNSALDYLAVNFSISYNYSGFNDDSGFIFGNQILANTIASSSAPFTIQNDISDPTVASGGIENVNSIDFGAGALYHRVLSDYSILRFGYTLRNWTRGYIGLPPSSQQSLVLKTLLVSYVASIKNNRAIKIKVIHIDQTDRYWHFLGNGAQQFRLDFSLANNFASGGKRIKSGFRSVGFEPGISLMFANREQGPVFMPSAISTFIGLRAQSNTDAGAILPQNPQKVKRQKRRNYRGRDWLFFVVWDYPTSNEFNFRDTYGNIRFGIVSDGWR